MNDPASQPLPNGWYPDPEDNRLMRYWNGDAWTDRVSERPESSVISDAAISDPTQTRYAEILQPDADEEPLTGMSRRALAITVVLGIVLAGILVVLATWALIDDEDGAGSGSGGGANAQISADEVVKTFARDGLPVTAVEVYTEGNDPDGLLGRQGLYTSKAAFRDATVQDQDAANQFAVVNGGGVAVFESAANAEKRMRLLNTGKSGEHVTTAGPVLLRLSPAMAPSEVAAYERSLQRSYG